MKIALSPCPNDTFCLSPWIEGLIESPSIEPHFFDIETLNKYALETPDTFPLIKVSSALIPKVRKTHRLLASGMALSTICGPTLVGLKHVPLQELVKGPIAIPGENTSSFYALQKLLPKACFVEIPYHQIISAILQKRCIAGILIHEARFKIEENGLTMLLDIGKKYKEKTHHVLPLGLFLVRNTLDLKTTCLLEKALHQSIILALKRKTLSQLTLELAQEMDSVTVQKHIDHYVTEETLLLTKRGIKALEWFVRF